MKIVFRDKDDMQIIADIDWFGYAKPDVAKRHNEVISKMIINFPRYYEIMSKTDGDDNLCVTESEDRCVGVKKRRK